MNTDRDVDLTLPFYKFASRSSLNTMNMGVCCFSYVTMRCDPNADQAWGVTAKVPWTVRKRKALPLP